MTQREIELAERVAKIFNVDVEVVKRKNLVDILEELVEVLERGNVSNT